MPLFCEFPNSADIPRTSDMWRYLIYCTRHSETHYIIKQDVKIRYSILSYNKYSFIMLLSIEVHNPSITSVICLKMNHC